MSPADDEAAEMHGLPFDASTADRFLSGGVVPDDAPPGLRDLATLIQAAKPPVSADGGAVEGQVVAAFVAAVRTAVGVSPKVHTGRKPMLGKLLTMKVAAAAATVVLGGTAAAAATGSLPAPIQSTVSNGLSNVGISVPSPNSHASLHAALGSGNAGSHPSPHAGLGAGNGNGHGNGDRATASSADAYGQCTAWAASTKDTNNAASGASVVFPELTAAAQAKGETIAQYCANVTPPSTVPSAPGSSHVPTSPDTPYGTSNGTPSGPPSSTLSGPPSRTPSGVTTTTHVTR